MKHLPCVDHILSAAKPGVDDVLGTRIDIAEPRFDFTLPVAF